MRSGIITIFAFLLSSSFLLSAPPANDNFANRTTLHSGASVNGTLAEATIEQGEFSIARGNPKRSVWYQISVPAGVKARLTVSPTLATMDTIITVATGNDLASYLIQFYSDRPGPGNVDKLAFANTTAGTQTFLINVGNQTSKAGSFQILFMLDPLGPANDLFADSTVLTGGGEYSGTTVQASAELSECAGIGLAPASATVWHTLNVPAGMRATIKVTPRGFNARVSTYQGSRLGALTLGPSADDAGMDGAEEVVLTNSGTSPATRHIAVDGVDQGSGEFLLNITLTPAPPLSDDLATAETLAANSSVNGTNINATAQPGELEHAGTPASNSVWYSFSLAPGASGKVTVTPADFDARIAVYTYGSGDFSGLKPLVAANYHGLGIAEVATIPANIFASTRSFVVAVDSVGGGTGSFNIQLETAAEALDFDDLANAAQLPANTFESIFVDTAGATSEAGEPAIGGQSPHSVWHRFSPPAKGRLNITLHATGGTAPSYAVFTGDSVDALATVLDYGAAGEIRVTPGQNYYIAISTPDGQHGTAIFQYAFQAAQPGEFYFGQLNHFAFEGDMQYSITVYRDGTDGEVSVPYAFTPGSASSADFGGAGGLLQFADGVSSQQIPIPIIDDSDLESAESFAVELGTPSAGMTTFPSTATVTIFYDPNDSAPEVGVGFYIPSAGFTGLVNSDFSQSGFGHIQFVISGSDVASGKVFFDGAVLPFRAEFLDGSDSATLTADLVLRRGGQFSNLTLTLTLLADRYRFIGTLAGISSAPYSIAGERDSLGSSGFPVPHAGVFNALLAGNAVVAGGGKVRGYARVIVKPTGAVAILGVLPDGTKFATKSQISLLGRLIFSTPLYKKELGKAVGYFTGSIDIADRADPKAAYGTTRWNKPANNGRLYPEGVTDAPLALSGAAYRPPARNQRVLADFDPVNGTAIVILAEGNLSAAIVKTATLTTANALLIFTPDNDRLKLKIAPATGLISGSLKHPDGMPRSITGLIVQSAPGLAEALFPGIDEAGVIQIKPVP